MAYVSPTITPSGTTFAQFQAGGASGQLERLIAANFAGTSSPNAATLTPTGGGSTGGSLAAGTYYVRVTETNGLGETTPGAEVSTTIAAGNIPQVTFAPLQTGNLARNVYVGTAAGAETLYATGITTGTFNLSAVMPTNSFAVPVPTSNTTGLVSVNASTGVVGNQKLVSMRACEKGALQTVWNTLARLIDQFNSGEPMVFSSVTSKLRDAHTTFAMMNQLCLEMGTLIDANPGHFSNVLTPIGSQETMREWP